LNAMLVGVLFVLTRSVKSMAETNAAQRREIKNTFKEHEADRLQWKKEKTAMQDQIDLLIESDKKKDRRITELEREAEAMNKSIVELSAALKLAQEEVRELKIREQQYKLDLAEAQREIATLKHDNLAKDNDLKALQNRVAELESKLQESEDKRTQAETRERELLAQLATLEAEPGETVTPTPEPSESESKEQDNG
jgi:chromosome segregation ATPase